MHGYHSRYLRIDVTEGRCTSVEIPEAVLRERLGGVGLGTWILQRELPTGTDPLSPNAVLVFAFSPLVGTALTTSAKFAVLCKSPLTMRLNDAVSSSHFAITGKKTGSDALAITGKAERPSILLVSEHGIELHPAEELWGQEIPVVAAALKERYPADAQASIIGPAGTNQVRYATLSHANRHAGRGGSGAVLGSKNLLAVVVQGNKRTTMADAAGLNRAAKDLSARSFGPATAKYRELGTVANLLTFNRLHALPTRNFQEASFEQAEALSGEGLNEARRVARESCAACTIGCEHIYATQSGQEVRLEYESLFALGPLCGIGDRDIVLQAARLCDRLGMDTISTGATIAFAMECVQRGLLNEPDLEFGNGPKLLEMIQRIAKRADPLADLLANGTRAASGQIGGEAANFAPHVKGLELPGYEPRTLQSMALGFAVGSRGADHNRSGAYEADFSTAVDRWEGSQESVRAAIQTEDKAALIDSLILCKFLRGVFTDLYAESAELLRLVTGWDVSGDELRQRAKEIINAKKRFNQREGWTREEDTLPARFLSTGVDAGKRAALLPRERLEAMVQSYYRERGWDEAGRI